MSTATPTTSTPSTTIEIDLEKALKNYPRLGDGNTDVFTWSTKLERFFEVNNIKDPKIVYDACFITTEKDSLRVLVQLKQGDYLLEEDNSNSEEGTEKTKNDDYPSFKYIIHAMKKYHGEDDDPEEAYLYIKNLSLRNKESIKQFNARYRQAYSKLDKRKRSILTSYDYANSIKKNKDASKKVLGKGDIAIAKAMEVAEKVDRWKAIDVDFGSSASSSTPRSSGFSQKKGNTIPKPTTEAQNQVSDIENLTNRFARMKLNVCYRCGQQGHIARFCQNEISQYNINLIEQMRNDSF